MWWMPFVLCYALIALWLLGLFSFAAYRGRPYQAAWHDHLLVSVGCVVFALAWPLLLVLSGEFFFSLYDQAMTDAFDPT